MSTINIKPSNPAAAVSAAVASAIPTATPVVDATPKRVAKPADKRGWWWGTGRRKSAVARIRIRPAKGEATFNIRSAHRGNKTIKNYFAEERDQNDCVIALKIAGVEGKFEIVAQVHGGGKMGQAQAIRLGVARALIVYDPSLHPALREQGFLTRDAREVERKKYGQAGARRRFQFSKR
ncbi:MAG: 30S ribosomal protein S9 [Planctomycetota bacterium]